MGWFSRKREQAEETAKACTRDWLNKIQEEHDKMREDLALQEAAIRNDLQCALHTMREEMKKQTEDRNFEWDAIRAELKTIKANVDAALEGWVKELSNRIDDNVDVIASHREDACIVEEVLRNALDAINERIDPLDERMREFEAAIEDEARETLGELKSTVRKYEAQIQQAFAQIGALHALGADGKIEYTADINSALKNKHEGYHLAYTNEDPYIEAWVKHPGWVLKKGALRDE